MKTQERLAVQDETTAKAVIEGQVGECRAPQAGAAQAFADRRGVGIVFQMAFSKLKTLLRKRAARTFDAISNAIGDICDLFSINKCRNFFKAAGYEAK